MNTDKTSYLYKTLKAIAEGYPMRVRFDRYIMVENPDYEPDNGKDYNLVIDVNDFK